MAREAAANGSAIRASAGPSCLACHDHGGCRSCSGRSERARANCRFCHGTGACPYCGRLYTGGRTRRPPPWIPSNVEERTAQQALEARHRLWRWLLAIPLVPLIGFGAPLLAALIAATLTDIGVHVVLLFAIAIAAVAALSTEFIGVMVDRRPPSWVAGLIGLFAYACTYVFGYAEPLIPAELAHGYVEQVSFPDYMYQRAIQPLSLSATIRGRRIAGPDTQHMSEGSREYLSWIVWAGEAFAAWWAARWLYDQR